MGKRSRFAAVAGAAVGIAGFRAVRRARRRARLRGAEGMADAIMPTVAEKVPPTSPPLGSDDAHASGHRHRPLTADLRDEPPPRPVQRPFVKHGHGLRHPGKG